MNHKRFANGITRLLVMLSLALPLPALALDTGVVSGFLAELDGIVINGQSYALANDDLEVYRNGKLVTLGQVQQGATVEFEVAGNDPNEVTLIRVLSDSPESTQQ